MITIFLMYLVNIYIPPMHFPGSLLCPTLMRKPQNFKRRQKWFMPTVVSHLPASKEYLKRFHQQQSEDSICSKLSTYLSTGWPSKYSLPHFLKPYWTVCGELSLHEGLLLYGSQIVIPTPLQKQILQKIHYGHQGIQRCRLRISTSVWWPGISKAIEMFIRNSPQCVKSYVPPKEPLFTSPLPNRPW